MYKNIEQKNVELNLKSDHTMKVLQIYNQENEKSRKIIELSNEILQETYFVLNGNMLLTETMRDKFSQLYKTHDQRGVKFTEADEVFEISEHHNQADFLFDADHSMTKDDLGTAEINMWPAKRARDSNDDDEVPTKKRVVRSIFEAPELNSTQVLEIHDDPKLDDGNINTTFAIKTNVNKLDTKGELTATRALKESNPNVHKAFVVPKAVTKPITKVRSTFVVPHREKENKRTPLKIRRSPRSGSVDPLKRSK